MEKMSLSEAFERRVRAQREMIEEHAQVLKRCCMELVALIDSGEYVREAAEEMLDKCRSTDALSSIMSEKQRRAYLVNGMEIATGKWRRRA